MSYCLNSDCQKPQNPEGAKFCQNCGSKLLLGERYRAIKPIGQGGFGKTFLGIDEYKPSRSHCVIKHFFPRFTGGDMEKAAELFRREAMQLDELGKHLQIPELLAHFEQDQQQYLIQEFIEGDNLEQELGRQGPFNEHQIRQLLQDLLPVLQFIHDRHIIHRDIKPENIIRRRFPVEKPGNPNTTAAIAGQLVLVDFGASKVLTQTNLYQTHTLIGSAGYVAPEQVLGKAVAASDLYSLGVTCIYLMTQVPPFDLLDGNTETWIWRHYLPSPVSEELGNLLDQLLALPLNERYPSATAVLDAVQNLKIIPPISPPPYHPQVPKSSPSFLNKIMGGFPQVITASILESFGKSQKALDAYDQAIAVNPNHYSAWYKKGSLLLEMNQYEAALYCYEKTLEIQFHHFQAWHQKGIVQYRLKRYEAAITSYLQSLEIKPNQPNVWLHLSLTMKQLGNDKKAKMFFEKAQQVLPHSPVDQVNVLLQAWEALIR